MDAGSEKKEGGPIDQASTDLGQGNSVIGNSEGIDSNNKKEEGTGSKLDDNGKNSQSSQADDALTKFGISNIEFDGLKETANIGTGHAAIALSNILKKKVNISLPVMNISKFSEISSLISFPKGNIVGVYSKIEEGLNGNIITMFPIEVVMDLLGLFYPDKNSKDERFEENEKKLMVKIGTATFMSYLSSLAKFFEKKIYFNPPNLVTSIGESVFDFMSLGVDDSGDVLLIKLGFDVENTDIKGDFILLFTLDSLTDILSNLKNKVEKGISSDQSG